ncbi:MAG: thiamine-phosphate kinase [Nitrospinota bacterium]
MRVAEIGEIQLVDRLQSLARQADESLQIGIGDDCAVIRRPDGTAWLVTTDCLVEDVHFHSAFTTSEELGAKAVAVTVSDIAAMGGTPRFALVTLGLPNSTMLADVEALYGGIRRACEHYALSLIGGDTTRAPHMLLSLVLIGEQDEDLVVARSGASPGDILCVTGTLGDAAFGLALLEEGVRAAGAPPDIQWLLHRHVAPLPRVLIGRRIAEAGLASSMIDLSDGLATDLKRLCAASGVGARIDLARLPCSSPLKELAPTRGLDPRIVALRGGEDYELLFTVPPEERAALDQEARKPGPLITPIGTMTDAPEGVVVVEPDGRVRPLSEEGFNHFRAPH